METPLKDFGPNRKHHTVPAYLSAAYSWCKTAIPPHPKAALLDCDLVIVEATYVQWTVKKPVWDDLSFVTGCVILLAAAIRRWIHCSRKEIEKVSNNSWAGCVSCSIVTKGPKVYQENILHTITTLSCWHKAGEICAFVLFKLRLIMFLLSTFGKPTQIVASLQWHKTIFCAHEHSSQR